jgi:cytoskeletal protein RodZ
MSIGDDLRNARRSRGVTVERLASVTKISPTVLRALEADDIDSLPGWVFVRGFLKTYAREVGLDPDKTVAAFLAQNAPAEQPGDEEAGAKRSVFHIESVREPIDEPSRDLGQMLTVAVIVIGAAAYLGLHNGTAPPIASAHPAASTVAKPVAADVPVAADLRAAVDAPVATAGFSPPQPVAAEADSLTLDLTATGECWVSATVDAEPRLQRLMNAGEHETIGVRESVTLRVGDPAALQLSINGSPARPLGEAGRPVTIHLTPHNAREYLAQ